MKKNIGTVDRVVRVVLALVIAVLLLNETFTGATAWILGIVAIVLAGTSVFSVCPAYLPFGISTTGKKS
jgi:hypothetical protein